jgi:hypothetical protein
MAQEKSTQESQSGPRAVDDIFGPPTIRRVPSMPVHVRCCSNHMTVALERTREGWIFRQGLKTATDAHKDVNARLLREAFLSVNTPEEALRFLDASGRFRFLRDKGDTVESVLTWTEFQLWQRLIRIVLVDNFLHLGSFRSPMGVFFLWGPTESGSFESLPDELRQIVLDVHEPTFSWLRGIATALQIVSDEEQKDPQHRPAMVAETIVNTSLDGMLAGIYIETQSGIEYELCALPDCSNVYEVQSKHQRAYCSQACAHKASVRRRRAEVEKAREAAKKRAAKNKSKKGRT